MCLNEHSFKIKSTVMKSIYFLILFTTILVFNSCKQKENGKERNVVQEVTDKEEDQEMLEAKIAPTEKIWDSLSEILKRKDLEEKLRDSVQREYLRNRYKQEEIYKEFIRENPNSEVSVESLNGFKFTWGKETTAELYNLLSRNIKNTEEGRSIKKYLTFYKDAGVNDLYTDFELKDIFGEKVKLSENLKNYTLLEFWASWCGGCRKKHPDLIKVYEEYKEEGFTVIGVSADDKEGDWREAVNKDELPWINVLMPEGRESIVNLQYGIHVLPTNFLIGPDGKILAKDVDPDQLEKILQNRLATAHNSI